MEEVFKNIKGYYGLYQVSNIGNVKSLARLSSVGRKLKELILKPSINRDGYLVVNLSKNGKIKTYGVQVVVAIGFLNHTPDGHKLVVDHKNRNRKDNNVNNLQIISNRENTNQKHLKSSSKYTGVIWHKAAKKWQSRIVMNGKLKYLGLFINEKEASNAYQTELNRHLNLKT